jgi:hypothetical protein
MGGHGTERDADHPAVTVRADDDERRHNAAHFALQLIQGMSFEEPGLHRMQKTRLCLTALAGVLCRFCELARDRRPNPPRVYCEGRIVHGRKDERAVLAHHACRDPRSIGARV